MAVQEFTTQELENEEWRPVVGYEGIYSVSNLGRVRRDKPYRTTKVGRVLTAIANRGGYLTVVLSDKPTRNNLTVTVHKLVARAFVGERPDGLEVNHKDGDKINNRASNLEYVTHKENQQHAGRLGLRPHGATHRSKTHPETVRRGTQCHFNKLSEADVLTIRRVYRYRSKELGCYGLAERYGVTPQSIFAIIKRESWTHI